MREQLEEEVKTYNELVEQIGQARASLERQEQDRLTRLGRIQLLSEIIEKETTDSAPSPPEVVEPDGSVVESKA